MAIAVAVENVCREDIAALELDYREVTEDSPDYEEYYDET